MRNLAIAFAFCLSLFLNSAAYAGTVVVTPRQQADAVMQIPRLTAELSPDGDLKEWRSAACMPMRHASNISSDRQGRQPWLGPTDAGAEVYVAWTAEGLCFAMAVADNDVRNSKHGEQAWLEDGLGFAVDARTDNTFMTTDLFAPGVHQILMRPPIDGAPEATVVSNDKKVDGLQIAGKKTKAGYTVEALIPWASFTNPPAYPGGSVAIGFALKDHDARGKDRVPPVQMTHDGKARWRSPQNMMPCKLVDSIETGPGKPLGRLVGLGTPTDWPEGKPLPLSVEIPSPLADRAASVRITVKDQKGSAALSQTVTARPAGQPWPGDKKATVKWRSGEETYTVGAVLLDRQGEELGSAEWSVWLLGRTLQDATAQLRRANLSRLVRSEPFKAAAYLGAAAEVERLKSACDALDKPQIDFATSAVRARLDILDNGKLDQKTDGVYDLLTLTSNAESQVAVEFQAPTRAGVTFYWGALPLTTVYVNRRETREDAINALEALDKPDSSIMPAVWEKTELDGLPARVRSGGYRAEACALADCSPDTQVVIVTKDQRYAMLFDLKDIPACPLEAAVILPDCPVSAAQAVEAWANTTNTPLKDLDSALGSGRVLVAGDVRASAVAEKLRKIETNVAIPATGFASLAVASGDRLITCSYPSKAVAETAIRLVVAAKPVRPEDADALRRAVVESLPDPGSAPELPAGMNLYCGDLHIHSFFSDGNASPVRNGLEVMYCSMDFAALTDHNTLKGAQLGQKLFHDNGLGFPYIVGEEISFWAHMNAYPLKDVVTWEGTPDEIVKAAHAQGAVVQLNHPGWPPSDWGNQRMKSGLAATEIDAWEHLPARYEEWKKGGKLPTLTGATDNHGCMFASWERTIILAPSPTGDEVANAVRSGRTLGLAGNDGPNPYLFGPDSMITAVRAALAEGKGLKEQKAQQLRAALQGADVAALVEASPPRSPR